MVLASTLATACSGRDIDSALQCVTEESLRQHVEYLSSDECDGRQPFSAGAERAVRYLESQMREIGLTPYDGKSFRQEVPLVEISSTPSEFMHAQTSSGEVELHLGDDFVAFSHNLEERVDIRGAELVFAGYGIVAPEYGKDDYQGIISPANTVAVVMVNDPGLGTAGDYFRGDEMTYYGRWTYKFEEGARQGLKGVLVIHDDRGAGYGWGVVSASKSRFAICGDSGYKCPLEGWLSKAAARRLIRRCGYDPDTLFAQARRRDFRPVRLGAKTTIAMRSSFSHSESPNVVGYIPGWCDDGESIVCIAHWDHLGHALTPVGGDSIINGATDNATAMAWLLETARAYLALGRRPRRNIVFLSPTCEEKGMHGSGAYVEHPLFPMDRCVAVINLDGIPLWGENNDLTITGFGQSDLDSMVRSIAASQGRYVMPDPEAYNGMFYRSDHLPFMRKGVPAMFAKGWNDSRDHGREWSQAKIEDYWANVYHKPGDQTNPETDDYGGLRQEVELFFRLLVTLADSDIHPKWNPNSEFSSIRDGR